MKTKLYLIRHGETEWNKLVKIQGCIDTNLSDEGFEQAHKVAEIFKGKIDCLYSSPLKRALKTADIIGNLNNLKPTQVYNLREIHFGEWEGLTIKEISEAYPKEYYKWKHDKIDAPILGEDISTKLASLRAKKAILDIVNTNLGKNIAIIAHGGIIKAALIGLFDWPMTMYHQMLLSNTAVTSISFNENLEPTIIYMNDTTHLKL